MTSFSVTSTDYVTEKRHQNNVTKFFDLGPPPIKISGYTSVLQFANISTISNVYDFQSYEL